MSALLHSPTYTSNSSSNPSQLIQSDEIPQTEDSEIPHRVDAVLSRYGMERDLFIMFCGVVSSKKDGVRLRCRKRGSRLAVVLDLDLNLQ